MSGDKSWAVGDELAFRCGSHSQYWVIAKIEKITPTGRMKCGNWEIGPDLKIRGRNGWHGPFEAEPVTDEIRAEIQRQKNLNFIREVKWGELSDRQLSEVIRIVKKS